MTALIFSIYLQSLPSKVSFTFDMWTSGPGDPYLLFTAHYIDAPADKPQEWKLRVAQLTFKHVEGRHMGKNMANILIDIIDQYGLRGKVSFITMNEPFSCCLRLAGLPVTVLLLMARLYASWRQSFKLQKMDGPLLNMIYCMS